MGQVAITWQFLSCSLSSTMFMKFLSLVLSTQSAPMKVSFPHPSWSAPADSHPQSVVRPLSQSLCFVLAPWLGLDLQHLHVSPWFPEKQRALTFIVLLPTCEDRHRNMLTFSGIWKYSSSGNKIFMYNVSWGKPLGHLYLKSQRWLSWQSCPSGLLTSPTRLPSASSCLVNGSFSGTCPALTLFGSSLDFFRMTSPHRPSVTTGLSYISYLKWSNIFLLNLGSWLILWLS